MPDQGWRDLLLDRLLPCPRNVTTRSIGGTLLATDELLLLHGRELTTLGGRVEAAEVTPDITFNFDGGRGGRKGTKSGSTGFNTSVMSLETSNFNSLGLVILAASCKAANIAVCPFASFTARTRSPAKIALDEWCSSSPRLALRSSCKLKRATGVFLRSLLSMPSTRRRPSRFASPRRTSIPIRKKGFSTCRAQGLGFSKCTAKEARWPFMSPRLCSNLAWHGQLAALADAIVVESFDSRTSLVEGLSQRRATYGRRPLFELEA